MGSFLSPSISQHPAYPTILSRLQSGAKLLDIGCYTGTDLRRLAMDGAPTANLYGSDIVNHWDLGYELFHDADKFHAHYLESDLLYPSKALRRLQGEIDVVSLCMCFTSGIGTRKSSHASRLRSL